MNFKIPTKFLLFFVTALLCLDGYSQEIEFQNTDTIFSQPLDYTRQISYKKVNRLIQKRKLHITDTLKNTSVYYAYYYKKKYPKVVLLKNEKGFLLISILKKTGDKYAITDTADITGDGNNEVMIHWSKSRSYDHTYSVGTATYSGIEIIDLKNKKIILKAILRQCGSGFNVCRGESSSGCAVNFQLSSKGNIFQLEDVNERYKHITYQYRYQDNFLVKLKK